MNFTLLKNLGLAVKIYGFVCLISAVFAASLYASESFNEMAQAIFRFYFAALSVAGLVMIIPASVNDHFAPKH